MFSRVVANCSAVIGINPRPAMSKPMNQGSSRTECGKMVQTCGRTKKEPSKSQAFAENLSQNLELIDLTADPSLVKETWPGAFGALVF